MYRLHIEKDYLGFDSAHFITYHGQCERLHGHSYQVEVEVEGTLGPDRFVFDFVELKRIMRELCKAIDHRVLLAAENQHLRFEEQGEHLQVSYDDKRYLFPRGEVVMLPIANTTAELLATYLCGQLVERLRAAGAATVALVAVAVSEGPGQSARFEQRL